MFKGGTGLLYLTGLCGCMKLQILTLSLESCNSSYNCSWNVVESTPSLCITQCLIVSLWANETQVNLFKETKTQVRSAFFQQSVLLVQDLLESVWLVLLVWRSCSKHFISLVEGKISLEEHGRKSLKKQHRIYCNASWPLAHSSCYD